MHVSLTLVAITATLVSANGRGQMGPRPTNEVGGKCVFGKSYLPIYCAAPAVCVQQGADPDVGVCTVVTTTIAVPTATSKTAVPTTTIKTAVSTTTSKTAVPTATSASVAPTTTSASVAPIASSATGTSATGTSTNTVTPRANTVPTDTVDGSKKSNADQSVVMNGVLNAGAAMAMAMFVV